jgi:hypothetical protein
MSLLGRVVRFVQGPPRDPQEPGAFHRLSLIAFLAWVGLGADGLSSSRALTETTPARGPSTLVVAIGGHLGALPEVTRTVREGVRESVSALGLLGALKVLMHASSLGGGTYTGIERDPTRPRLLLTEIGVGYRLSDEPPVG